MNGLIERRQGRAACIFLAPALSLIGLFFLGLFLASIRWFLTTFPVVQIWQPMIEPESLEAEVREVEGAPV